MGLVQHSNFSIIYWDFLSPKMEDNGDVDRGDGGGTLADAPDVLRSRKDARRPVEPLVDCDADDEEGTVSEVGDEGASGEGAEGEGDDEEEDEEEEEGDERDVLRSLAEGEALLSFGVAGLAALPPFTTLSTWSRMDFSSGAPAEHAPSAPPQVHLPPYSTGKFSSSTYSINLV